MRETDGPNSNVVGEKLCKHKYSSYPYCYGEISTDVQGIIKNFIEILIIDLKFLILFFE